MCQLVKAMTVAGMFAAGLPLLTEAANAQTPNTWYLIEAQNIGYCRADLNTDPNGSILTTDLVLYVNLSDGSAPGIWLPTNWPMMSVLFQACADGTAFYAYYNTPALGFTNFYTVPGLK